MTIRLTEQEASELLETLCIKLGICLEPKMNSRLTKNPPTTAERFATVVYRTEGLDPSLQSDLYKQVLRYAEAAFQQHLDQISGYNV
jgi:hypothetical protein